MGCNRRAINLKEGLEDGKMTLDVKADYMKKVTCEMRLLYDYIIMCGFQMDTFEVDDEVAVLVLL